MSLNQAVAAYTSSWEGHAENEGDRYVAMVDLLSDAPLDEIQLEANALTSQELWVPSVIDAFYDALLDRILNETTFCISTAWTTVQHWLTHPYVTIQVGFNDFYHVLDQNGDPIRHDQPYRSYTLMNASFTESQQYQIIRMLLDNTVIALINLGTDITIVGLESAKDPSHRIIFSDLGPSTARVPAQIRELLDWNGYRRTYEGIRKNDPVVVDPQQEVLINQLIDYPEALDIIANGGITYENIGDGLIDAEPELE